jgi:hypothetical protein
MAFWLYRSAISVQHRAGRRRRRRLGKSGVGVTSASGAWRAQRKASKKKMAAAESGGNRHRQRADNSSSTSAALRVVRGRHDGNGGQTA